jgi:single-stranded-DNA-specific exonuclease
MGLKALCDVSGVSNAPTSFDLGYVLGPRINAGGRVGDSTFGERLLATDDRLAAEHLAQSLNSFNADRKAIETAVIQAAEDKISSEMSPGDAFVFISGENWHTGVIGIIAGRIKEKYRLPAFVATIDGAGMANGSGRSVPGVDIGAAIIKAKEQGILSEGGGHPMAAGFTLPADRIPRFKEFLRDFIASSGKASLPTLAIDAVVDIAGINAELVKSLAILEPFGAGNEEPRFAVLDARLSSSDAIGGGNIRCFFAGDNGRSVGAILYRGYDTPLGEALLGGEGKRFKVAGKIRTNEYMGRSSLQLVIDDIAEIGGL